MKRELVCKRCKSALTLPLTILSTKDPGVTWPACEIQKSPSPRGAAFKSYEAVMVDLSGATYPLQFAETVAIAADQAPLAFIPQYWINPEDVLSSVQDSPHPATLSGCCGMSGINGPNQVCKCGAEIGTRQSDCFTMDVFIPEPDATEWLTSIE
jgi:hypothetical protein